MSKFHIDNGFKKKISFLWIIPALIVVIALVVGTFMLYWYQQNLHALSGSEQETIITIDQGATANQIGEILENKEIIKSARAFEWYTRLNNSRGSLQAGGYKFSPSEDVQGIVKRLSEGDVAKDLITILPGQRLDQIRASFKEAGYTDQEIKIAFNPSNYAGHPALEGLPAGASLEGLLYPDSFQRTSNTTLTQLLRASLDQLSLHLTDDYIVRYKAEGLSVYQAIILASIVEKEVSNPADKPTVAQVFLRRFKEGIVLGSDVTAFYGAQITGLDESVITDTPYNTRIHGGLPPGPISNVSADSLSAVAYPATTNYLYFVAGDDGKTYFANTLAEHQSNVVNYCTKLCQ